MDSVNKTLYIPLYGKSLVSNMGIILKDETAEYICSKENIKVGRRSRNKFLAYFMAMRAKVFDRYLSEKISSEKGEICVLHLGCGLDSRNIRVESCGISWYDVDLPEVITERKKYFTENDNYKMIPSDIRDKRFLDEIQDKDTAVVLMEGICMYIREDELKSVINNITEKFPRVHILADFYSVKAAKLSKYKNPVNEVGVTTLYGMDDPSEPENGTNVKFVREHDMTPPEMIGELPAIDRFIFRNLYAGKFAKGLYRIFEYEYSR